jgi:L-methionine (R)-S-oxide reductase
MAETIPDVRDVSKSAAYRTLTEHWSSTMEGIRDPIAGMATLSALLHHGFRHLWTGFYRVVEPRRLLRVGPYQGSLGCLEIAFGRGVCGTAAAEQRTVLVEDVHAFPGHITCDARSRSEIVVPTFGPDGALIAVLDIDSDQPSAFDDTDRMALELMLQWFAQGS